MWNHYGSTLNETRYLESGSIEKKRNTNAMLFIFESTKGTFAGKDKMKKTIVPISPTNTRTCETGIDEAKNLFIASLHAKQVIAKIIKKINPEFLLNEHNSSLRMEKFYNSQYDNFF